MIKSTIRPSNNNPVEGCGLFSVTFGAVALRSVAEALAPSILRSAPVGTTRLATASVSALCGRSITSLSSKTEEAASGASGSHKAFQMFGNFREETAECQRYASC
jgi:hypothetical protein